MPTPGHIQVAPDSSGKDIDAQSLTSSETTAPTVYRQTITIGDPTTYANLMAINSSGNIGVLLARPDTNELNAVDNEVALRRNDEIRMLDDPGRRPGVWGGPVPYIGSDRAGTH